MQKMPRQILALLFFFFVCIPTPLHAQEAKKDDDLFKKIDAAFGTYLVAPLGSVMFYDLVFWDNTLKKGEIINKPLSLTFKDKKKSQKKWMVSSYSFEKVHYEVQEFHKYSIYEVISALNAP